MVSNGTVIYTVHLQFWALVRMQRSLLPITDDIWSKKGAGMKPITRRTFIGAMGTSVLVALTGCGSSQGNDSTASVASPSSSKKDGTPTIILVTDIGTVHDQSFNELSWSGLAMLNGKYGWDVSYIDSVEEPDYKTRLDQAVERGADLVWGVGFMMGDAVMEASRENPDVAFGIIDVAYDDPLPNLTGITFRQEECSFAVGYIAARTTKSNKVGFIGGVDSTQMQLFEQGYYAGIEYANKEQGLSVAYQGIWSGSFTDDALGQTMAYDMITDGCDVIYHAAGVVGLGVIRACSEAGVWAIGVDQDQSYLAPGTVITSALKRVDQAIAQTTERIIKGELQGGSNIVLGASDDAVGIATTHDLLPDDLYNDALQIVEKIKTGEIVVPRTADEFKAYVASL